jgi:dUTP pyrophosphatase
MKMPLWVKNLLLNKGVRENGFEFNNDVQEEINEVDNVLKEVEEVRENVDRVVEEVKENLDDVVEDDYYFISEIVEITMVDVIGQLKILNKLLQDDNRCPMCGGYKVYKSMNPEYYKVLNAVGYGEGNVCNCEVEVACEENDEENAQFAAEFVLIDPEPKKRRKGTRKQAPKKCSGNCENCKCHKDDNEPFNLEEALNECHEVKEIEPEFADDVKFNKVDIDGDYVDEPVVLQEDNEVNLYYNSLFEEAAEFMLNKPVEVIWACEEGVEPPTKNEEDMGFDVKAHFEEEYMMFAPHETKLVPTGLYAAVSTLWGLLAREKGSTGAIGMKCGAGVVDSGYRGEIFIAITNENDCHLVITKDPDIKKAQKVEWVDWNNNQSFDAILYPYKKGIAQLLVKFNPKVETKVVSVDELKAMPSLRGDGKLGSTDNF